MEGPADKLNTTVVSQPAIYVASLAAVEKLRMDKAREIPRLGAACSAGAPLRSQGTPNQHVWDGSRTLT